MTTLPHLDDAAIRDILTSVTTIAVVGASTNPDRPSNHVTEFLVRKGFKVFPINPGQAGKTIEGRTILASLDEVPVAIDMVDVFRASEAVAELVEEAIAHRAKIVWTQLGVFPDAETIARAEAAGLRLVVNRCPAIEMPRLGM